MTDRQSTRRVARTLGVICAVAVLASGCGTRADDAEIAAGAGGGPAPLPLSALDQVREALGNPGTPVVAPGGSDAYQSTLEITLDDPAPTGSTTKPGPAPATTTGGAATNPTEPARCSGNAAPVVLGQVGTFSGVAGPITASARTTAAVWAKSVNARGGLACHPVELYTVDDGGDPARTAALIQDLVVNKQAVALVAAFAVLTMNGLISAVDKYDLPVIGGDLAGFEWNSHPNLFPQGAGLEPLIQGLIRQAVDSGKTKLGLLYCVEATVCTTGAKVIPEEAKKAGAELVYSSQVSLTQTDFTAQCQNAKNAGVQVLGVAVDGSSIGRIARSCAALNYHPQFGTSALVLNPAQARDPAIRENTVTTATPNAPWFRNDNPGLREYHQALLSYAPDLEADANSMAAWAAGKLAEAAAAGLPASAAAAPLTSKDLFAGLGTIRRNTLDGLAPPITFSPGQKSAPNLTCTYYALLTVKGWAAASGSKPVCAKGR